MELRVLGQTGLSVSRLCFGSLVMGPLQKKLSIEDGASVIAEAFKLGVNFIDTAELYNTYPYIKRAIEMTGLKPVIATKSYAFSRESAKRSVDKALSEMGVDQIDIFLMHEQESEHTLRGHWEALEYYRDLKAQGVIKAIGISTHHIAAVWAAAETEEIEVIHPIVNIKGLGICDGTIEEMLAAIEKAHKAGKGIYGMKVFGGGNLLFNFKECLRFAMDIPWLDAIAIGMQSIDEVQNDVAYFEDPDHFTSPLPQNFGTNGKALHAAFWCEGCGSCIDRCKQRALSLKEGKLVINESKCVLCGYCSAACPTMALKVY